MGCGDSSPEKEENYTVKFILIKIFKLIINKITKMYLTIIIIIIINKIIIK